MRVLFIQFKRLGDVLMVTPAVKALKTSYPQAILHFLVQKESLPAIQHHPLVDRIIIADDMNPLERLRRLRGEHYDVAIDFMGTPRSARWTWLSGANIRIGFPKRGRTLFYNHRVPLLPPDTYSAEEKLSLLAPLNINPGKPIPELYTNPTDKQKADDVLSNFGGKDRLQQLVAFSPVSRKHYKRWPAEHYSVVCDYLYQTWHFNFLPLFGPGEEHMVEAVIARSKHPEAFLYPYTPISLGGAKVLIEHCHFYLGNDNGIRHVAIACGKPTATIFGSIDPMNWTPHGNMFHRYRQAKDNIALVSPSEVIEMVSELLPLTMC